MTLQRTTPRLRGLPVLGFAAGGLLLGHAVSYLLALPDPQVRDLVMRRTGHAYLPVAGEIALIMVLSALAAILARACAPGDSTRTERFVSTAGRLVAIQVLAFIGQEVLERLVVHAPLGELIGDHILAIGILVQVGIALLAAVLLRWLARTAARFVDTAAAVTSHPEAALPVAVPPRVGRRPNRLGLAAAGVRAPPSI